jgi:hypothetical protein
VRTGCGLAGTGSCESCAQGSHKDGPHQWNTGCKLCGTGKYGSAVHSRTGEHHCRNCPAGQFRDASGFTDCVTCAVGQYQSETGEIGCMKCIAGQFTPSRGQKTCEKCAIGHHQSTEGKASCTTCTAGRFADEMGLQECKQCQEGRYNTGTTNTNCKGCAVGRFQGSKGKTGCEPCAKGYVQPDGAKASCAKCPAATYAPTTGLTTCESCEVGKFQAQQGQASCTACLVGQFNADKKQTACTKCAEGRYQNARQATSCTQCAAGYFGAAGALGSSDPSYCERCTHGTYNPTKGSTSCTKCLKGKAGQYGGHAATDENHCTTCAAGRFMHMDGGTHEHRAHSCDASKGECNRGAGGAFAECLACPRIDDRRYQTSVAGSTTCASVSLDCKPASWSNWGTCTKSCTPMTGALMNVKGESGTHYRTRSPEQLLPCALGNAATVAAWTAATGLAVDMTRCDMAWGGGKECSAFPLWVGDTNVQGGQYYKQQQQCNQHECPVDCVPRNWGAWGACTATCGSGSTTRTRAIKIPEDFGGKACANGAFPQLHAQTETCNADVSCDKNALPVCQTNHVHCDIKTHALNQARSWMSSIDSKGVRYYHNILTGLSQHEKPDGFVECAAPLPAKWQTSKTTKRASGTGADDVSPYQTHGRNTITHYREGDFHELATARCINNQNCGLVDLGACHGCDTEQECKDMGLSSTLFVTHHRKYMAQQRFNPALNKYEQAKYHCKREGVDGCKCTCDAHPPCVVKQGYVLRECKTRHSAHNVASPHAHALADDDEQLACNRMLHGNAYPNVPNMQDCCNMCTNHPKCDAWEYSSTKLCVLKSGAPAFKAVPSDSTFAVWSGCRAGETC